MKFYKCLKCGNVIEMFDEKTNNLVCCGDKMIEMIPNTSDGAMEKHVPSCHIEDDIVIVNIGEVTHPMTEDHYITCVIAEYSDSVVRYNFNPNEEINIMFDYEKGMKVYAYCNLHGLWMSQL